MKVILTRDVDGLGHRGDVLDVANGYARNYLVPKSMAIKATPGAVKEAETVQRIRAEALAKAKGAADALAEGLTGAHVVVAARSADEGKLFGSIGTADVSAAIHKFTGIEVDTAHIQIGAPIREIGLHQVSIKPHPEVEFPITLDVIPA